MSKLHLTFGLLFTACLAGFLASPANATQILVGQCVEGGACYSYTTPWSDTLTLSQLDSLGLGSTESEIATETSQYVIRLGVTTFDFTTSTGAVVDSIGEFNGPGEYSDPGPFPSELLVGTFYIPDNATGLTVSGTFGNSVVGSSAGTNVCLGSGACASASAVPEPSTWMLMLFGFAGLGFAGYRQTKRKGDVAFSAA